MEIRINVYTGKDNPPLRGELILGTHTYRYAILPTSETRGNDESQVCFAIYDQEGETIRTTPRAASFLAQITYTAHLNRDAPPTHWPPNKENIRWVPLTEEIQKDLEQLTR